MTLKDLDELLAQAVHARDGTGRSAVAERLVHYRAVVDAFELLLSREHALQASLKALHPLTQALARALTDITNARTVGGPTVDQVSAYYRAASDLRQAVQRLRKASATLEN